MEHTNVLQYKLKEQHSTENLEYGDGMNDTGKLTVNAYRTSSGKEPFTEWLDSIRDKTIRGRIERRMDRVENGNMGDCKRLGTNLYELRFDFGTGYRIYFTESDSKTILILCAGDKSSQTRDIKRAKEYSLDVKQRYEGYNDGTI